MPDHRPGAQPDSESDRIARMAELVGGLAHELRNPLSTLMVNLQLLQEDLKDERTSADDARRRAAIKVDVLRREAARLQDLFDQFLNLTAPFELRRTRQNVNDIVANLVAFIEPEARADNIEIQFQPDKNAPPCEVDAGMLRQALTNIIINARQAMGKKGTLTIRTIRDSRHVDVVISDTGPGIPEADRDRILRPFFSTKARGTGLGLSITDRIVREHDGELTCNSTPGKGATFTIRLPAAPP